MNVKLRILSAGALFFLGYSVSAQRADEDTTKVQQIEEVVVQGYRTVSKRTSVTSSATISAEKLESRPNPNVMNSAQGQLPGVNISTGTGQPGAKSTIIIRGQGTLQGSTDPLYVIDGFPSNSDTFRSINPNDIESLTVLKDAASLAEYGNRAANGVIVIRTKRGSFSREKMTLNYKATTGIAMMQEPRYRLANAKQLLSLEKDRGVGRGVGLTDAEINAYDVDTDWAKHFFRPSFLSSHDLSLNTSGNNFASYTNVGYLNQDGILRGTSLNRFTVRNNIQGRSENRKFSYYIGTGIGFSRNNEATSLGTGGVNQNPVLGAYQAAPYISPSEYQNSMQLFQLYQSSGNLVYTPLFLMDKLRTFHNRTDENKFNVSTELSYKIFDNLRVMTRTSGEYLTTRLNRSQHPVSFNSYLFRDPGEEWVGWESFSNSREFLFNQLLQLAYDKKIGDHTFILTGNGEYNFSNIQTDGFTQNGLNPLTFVPGAGTGYITDTGNNDFNVPTVFGSQARLNLLSFFGSLDYDYDRRYGIVATGRRDGSSRFYGDRQWSNFWSLGARWNISEESFMQDISWLDMLKFRASIGTVGNQRVVAGSVYAGLNPPLWQSTYGFSNNVYNGGLGYGISFADRDIHWETTKTWNLGLDWELFNRRFRGAVDFYDKKTTDILGTEPFAPISGTTAIITNTPIDIQNRGVDLQLFYDVIKNTERDITLTLNFNGNYNDNKVFDVPNGFQQGDVTALADGYAINTPYVYQFIGVNQSNGNLLYADANGNPTETPVEADKKFSKYNFQPEYQGGFGFDLNVKGFFASTLFTYVKNITRFDWNMSGYYEPANIGQFNVSSDLLNAWTPTNAGSNIPSLTADLAYNSTSDRFLRDASYLRVRNAQIGYTFPQSLLENTFVKRMSVFVQGENLYTWTKWQGYDPESNRGSDQNQYPSPRAFTLGFDVTF